MEYVGWECELDSDLLGRVLASFEEREYCVPYSTLSYDWVDERSRVEVLDAEYDGRAVGPAVELDRQVGQWVSISSTQHNPGAGRKRLTLAWRM